MGLEAKIVLWQPFNFNFINTFDTYIFALSVATRKQLNANRGG